MIFDLHVHVAGSDRKKGNRIAPAFRRRLAFKFFAWQFGFSEEELDQDGFDERMSQRTLAWLSDSQVGRAVLLALDRAYHEDGTPDEIRTLLVTDNDFVADLVDAHEKTLFGASVHPYRRDAISELERLIERGACLVKWLPGAQNIQPDHPDCIPFYEALAHHGIPLLCHTGGEHTLKAFPNTLNDPRRLIPALERGVTVIAAHCGTRLFLHEKSYFDAWCEMALRYENFYGDLSAFGVITRTWPLRTLLKDPRLASKLVYGSDFPVMPILLSCIGTLGVRRALELRKVANPLDQAYLTMKSLGVTEEIFSRAEKLLRIPPNKLNQTSKPERVLAL